MKKIPMGDYCYEVLSPILMKYQNGQESVIGHHIRYCSFWYGERLNGNCLLYGFDFAQCDAIKICGINQPEDYNHD